VTDTPYRNWRERYDVGQCPGLDRLCRHSERDGDELGLDSPSAPASAGRQEHLLCQFYLQERNLGDFLHEATFHHKQ
jgi:hypothetical protein